MNRYQDPLNLTEKPLASEGLISYRCKNRFGWTMIGATDDDDAMNEARRSDPKSKREDLQIWSEEKGKYVPV